MRVRWNCGALLAGVLLGCASESRGAVLFEREADARDAGPIAPDACAACAVLELTDEGTTALVGGGGGSERFDLCPPGQLLTGYVGALRDVSATQDPVEAITYLEGRCGVPSLASDGALRMAPGAALPSRGEAPSSAASWSQLCPIDHVVIGASGQAGLALDGLALLCGSFRADASGVLTVQTQRELIGAGGRGGAAFSLRCAPGQLARGHDLRAGRWIDAFSLACSSVRALAWDVAAP